MQNKLLKFVSFGILPCLFIGNYTSVLAQDFNQYDQNGQRHGAWQKFYEGTNQVRYEGTFDHGKEVGIFKFYNRNSGDQPNATKSYTAGSSVLDVIYYQKNGKKASEGQIDGRERTGKWVYYHKNGKSLLTTEMYRNGLLEGLKTVFFENGTPARKTRFINGKEDGLDLKYTEKGVLLSSYTYVTGELHGPVKINDVDGNLLREGNYKDGKKHGTWNYYKSGKLDKTVKFPVNRIGVQN